jgi:hypothetical protein
VAKTRDPKRTTHFEQIPLKAVKKMLRPRRVLLTTPGTDPALAIVDEMAPKTCTVSVTVASGSRYSVEVLAESLYEAAALGLKLLRDADWVDTLGPMTRLQLQVRAPTVMHEVTIQQLQRWLDGAPISPHEAVRKAKLKSILR